MSFETEKAEQLVAKYGNDLALEVCCEMLYELKDLPRISYN